MYHFHIADDHPLFRSALVGIIHQHFHDVTMTESCDLDSTLHALAEHSDIDLLLLDLNMPGSQDLFGLITVRERFPTIPVSVVSATETPTMVNRALSYGASGYIPKSSSPAELHDAINSLAEGKRWIPDDIAVQVRPITKEEKSLTAKVASLTPQQYRVLCHIREGWLNKQIAFELNVTEATVKAHVTAIFKKLEVSNRTQAVIALSKLSLEKEEDEVPIELAAKLGYHGTQTSGTHRFT